MVADCRRLRRDQQTRTTRELTPDWVNVDHRRGAAFAAGEMTAYSTTCLTIVPDIHVYVEVVHRLDNLGAVITQAGHGTSQEGFQAEWREIGIFVFDGDLLSRYELFDEADLDAALARFDELQPQAPRLENAASQVQRFSRRTSRPATGMPWRSYWPTSIALRRSPSGRERRDSDTVEMP